MTKPKKHIKKTTNVPELKVGYHSTDFKQIDLQITSAEIAADFFRSIYIDGEIELRESFYVLFLNHANMPIGYHLLSIGGIASTFADVKIALGIALKALASNLIIVHNHPSGNLKPSQSDIDFSNKFKKTAELLDIALLDSLIVTKKSYCSLAYDGYLKEITSPYPIQLKENSSPKEQLYNTLELEALALQLKLELLAL